MSNDTIADLNPDTVSALREKHPPRQHFPPVEAAINTSSDPYVSNAKEIADCVSTFPNGSSGGIDGVRPDHLKDMLSVEAHLEANRRGFTLTLCRFITFVLEGDLPEDVKLVFFGARLVALKKKDGGIRPIAVGHTMRRLASK